MKERIALIDIGSNSIRLVVYQIHNNYLITEIQNIKVPARLYLYLDQKSRLSDEGIKTLTQTLHLLSEEAKVLNSDILMAKATAAIRQAKNQAKIIKEIKNKTGIDIEVVSEEEEAYYGINAVLHSMSIKDCITIDIGGGSTEIGLIKDKKIIQSHSFPFGAVSLSKQFYENKKNKSQKAYEKTTNFIQKHLQKHPFMKNAQLPLVAIGGSARNLVRVHQNISNYSLAGLHNYQMTQEALQNLIELFRRSSLQDMQSMDGLSSDRADIILPAALVFQEVMDYTNALNFTFSQRGLREGILYDYIQSEHKNAYDINRVDQQAVEQLNLRFNFSQADAAKRLEVLNKLYTLLYDKDYFILANEEEKMMYFAAYAFNCGSFIEAGSASQHTFYLLSNTNLNGFNHRQRIMLSLIASYKNNTLFKTYIKPYRHWFSQNERKRLQQIGGLVKFCQSLNVSHRSYIDHFKLKKNSSGNEFILEIHYYGEMISEKIRATDQKKLLKRILDENVELDFIQISKKY